jgi:endonuclease/exonuclease/phosphatase family metal-dependent hydrolase
VGQAGEWRQIVTGGSTGCGIKATSALFCWGQNNRGQLGFGGTQKWEPQQVGRATGWTDVSASWLHTCAVRSDTSLWCWGENSDGQLGLGHRRSRPAPTKVGVGWRSVTTGGWHTCAIKTNGTAWCWGLDDLGQLGTGSGARQLRPTAVAPRLRWRSLDATWSSTCGLTPRGQVLCWGLNDQGQLGDGTRRRRNVPTALSADRGWSAVTVGDAFGCALDSLGAAWCWGNNDYGQLGDGTTTARLRPAPVAGGRAWATIDAGWMHTCATTLDESLQCWGNNENGQLAQGDQVDRSAPPGVSVVTGQGSLQAPRSDVVVSTFNVLGSQHTRPGGGAGNYAPGRIRTEWSKNLLTELNSGIVAFQELQVDQYDDLKRAVGDTHAFFPASTRFTKRVWQSVMWERSQWTLVDSRIVTVPVIGRTRPNPMLRLRNKVTGRDVWVLNVHNSSKKTPERQRERNRAVRIEVDHILAERRQRVPVIFLGDMNERQTVFCKVTAWTDLESVTGGSNRKGRCRPPKAMRLDWMFASPELPVREARFVRDARVARITDHAVLTSRLGLP